MNLFYAFNTSNGLILLILPLINALEKKAIKTAKISIGNSEKTLKENEKPRDSVLLTSKLATIETQKSSIDATRNEIMHCINECQNKNLLLSLLLTPRHLANAISLRPSIMYR